MAGNYVDIVSGEAMNSREVNSVFIVTNIFTSWVSVPVQIFFTWRIWRFKNPIRWAFVVFLSPCILFHFAMGIVMATAIWIKRNNPNAISRSTMMAIKYPGRLTHIAFCFIIAPIYDNMFLANLNARSYIREGVDRVIEFEKSGATSGLSSVRDCSIQMVSMMKGSKRDTTLIDSTNSTVEGKMQIRMETVRYEKYDNVPLT
ncbi:hypothetical protein H1R20_g12539, partial [Candolleomyces eurysporus]